MNHCRTKDADRLVASRGSRWAAALKPDFTEAFYNRAGVFVRLQRYEEAVRDCDRAIALKSGDPEVYNTRAGAHFGLGRYDQARRDCDRAIARKPDYAAPYDNRAVAYYRENKYDQALSDVKTFRKLGGQVDPEFLKSLLAACEGGR